MEMGRLNIECSGIVHGVSWRIFSKHASVEAPAFRDAVSFELHKFLATRTPFRGHTACSNSRDSQVLGCCSGGKG